MNLLFVCGSLHAASSNGALLRRAATIGPPEHDCSHFEGLRALPHFDLDLDEDTPAPVLAWRAALAKADGVLFATPEYGHSLPGALKNAIDWVFGSGELYRKPVGITAAVRQPGRGRRGLRALRQTLLALEAQVLVERAVVLPDPGDEQLRRILTNFGTLQTDSEAQTQLGARLLNLVQHTSLEGCIPAVQRVPFGEDPLAAAAHQMGVFLGDAAAGLPSGEFEQLLHRVELGLADTHPELRDVLGGRLLPSLLVSLEGTALLDVAMKLLGPLSRRALESLE